MIMELISVLATVLIGIGIGVFYMIRYEKEEA